MKKILFLFLAINVYAAQAQFVAIPHTMTINTPVGNFPITTYTYMNFPMYFGSTYKTNEYHFKVTLQNDSTFEITSKIYLSEKKQFVAQTGKAKFMQDAPILRKFYPYETKEIEAHFDEYDFVGIPNDSCWLFRTNEDSIYTYSMLPEDKDYFITFFRRRGNTNPILPVTQDNVTELVKSDDDLKKLADKGKAGKLIKAIKEFNKKYTK